MRVDLQSSIFSSCFAATSDSDNEFQEETGFGNGVQSVLHKSGAVTDYNPSVYSIRKIRLPAAPAEAGKIIYATTHAIRAISIKETRKLD